MKFKVGDKVRVRKWEDMENEFGLNVHGDINCKYSFVNDMTRYCGQIVTIKNVFSGHYCIEEDGKFYPIHWIWTDDMFESEVVKEDELELIE
jgi:hypothetical protein